MANTIARLPQPTATLERSERFWEDLQKLIAAEGVEAIVVGLPRSLEGADTQQTTRIRQFAEELQAHFSGPVSFQDEALTSRQAEAELRARGRQFAKGDIDALAAVYILEDHLRPHEAWSVS